MFRVEEFLDAFKSALEDKDYIYLEPMNKSGGWAEIYYIYSQDQKEVRVAKVYKEPLERINEDIYKSDAKKLMKIEHENVVKIFDKGVIEADNEKYFFLILEYVRGKSFEDMNSRLFFELPYNERLEYFLQALDGINEFRKNFDLHRDLHPGNIILSDENEYSIRKIKIIDPGSSRYYYEPGVEDIDLYSIKQGLFNLFLQQEEINKINESINLRTIEFPELRDLIKKLIKKEVTKIKSERFEPEIEEKIENFFQKRLNELNNGEYHVNIPGPARMLIHMISIDTFDANSSFNLEIVFNNFENHLKPPGCILGRSIKRNLSGLLVSCGPDPYSENYVGYVQLYRNGMIEAINSSLLKPTIILHGEKYAKPVKKLGMWILEKNIICSCSMYLNTLEKIGVGLPIYLYLSFIHMKGYKISLIPYKDPFLGKESEAVKRNEILLQRIKIDDYDVDLEKKLKSSFDIFWNAFNQRGSRNYDASGKFISDIFKV